MTPDERLIALAEGREVGEACPKVHPVGLDHSPRCDCHGTGRIRTEPANDAERMVALLRYRYEQEQQALAAEQAAHQELQAHHASDRCMDTVIKLQVAHEETKRQLAIVQAEADQALEDRVLSTTRIKGLERQLAEWQQRGHGYVCVKHPYIGIPENVPCPICVAENERDTALRERDEARADARGQQQERFKIEDQLIGRLRVAENRLAESALREGTLREALRTITRHAGHLVDVNADMVHDGATSWKPCFSYCPTCVARHALATPTAGTPLVDAVRALVVATIPISKWLDQRHMMYDWERPAFGKIRNDLDTACAALEAAWPGVKGA